MFHLSFFFSVLSLSLLFYNYAAGEVFSLSETFNILKGIIQEFILTELAFLAFFILIFEMIGFLLLHIKDLREANN